MARGYRKEVRNDAPTVSETPIQARQRVKDDFIERTKPSRNKPKYRLSVPAGCIEVWRVSKWDGYSNTYHGIFRSEEEAYRVADDVYVRDVRMNFRPKVTVEHKAAILIGDKFFFVNLVPIKFTEPHPATVAAILRPTSPDELKQ